MPRHCKYKRSDDVIISKAIRATWLELGTINLSANEVKRFNGLLEGRDGGAIANRIRRHINAYNGDIYASDKKNYKDELALTNFLRSLIGLEPFESMSQVEPRTGRKWGSSIRRAEPILEAQFGIGGQVPVVSEVDGIIADLKALDNQPLIKGIIHRGYNAFAMNQGQDPISRPAFDRYYQPNYKHPVLFRRWILGDVD